jgi:GNAT superfamily N-acetyltransferase
LWWRETPVWEGWPVGAIGGFEAVDEGAALRVLAAAEARLREAGAHLAVGPMDGNTWRRYRWVTESDGRGPFLLEPENPPEYPQWWKAVGFRVMASYSSSVIEPGAVAVAVAVAGEAVRAGFAGSGFTMRQLDAARYEDELRRIHDLSLRGFARNFLYTPLAEEEFVAAYAKVRQGVDPECVWLVERGGELCAFLFGIPDHAAAARGEHPALIAKTIAVEPGLRGHGIGGMLLDELNATAWRKGYREVIHALQHEANLSLKITGRHGGRVFRRYELLMKPL